MGVILGADDEAAAEDEDGTKERDVEAETEAERGARRS